jgi:spore maturation protein CgeB
MKIVLVAPKSTTGHKYSDTEFRFDYAYWNFYLPLLSLGHQVLFFDTSIWGDQQLSLVVEREKPDMLFCIMTGDPGACPQEPWETIKTETESGRTFTFNWFCDDAWRFDNFSKDVCKYFNAVVTTDNPDDVLKYKKIGYYNCIFAHWHANGDVYSGVHSAKASLISFVGNSHGDRKTTFDTLESAGVKVDHHTGVSFEDMIWNYSRALMGLSLSKNSNDEGGKLILKARPFEITAVGSLLVAQNAVGLSDCFELNKEAISFETTEELIEKCKFLSTKPKIIHNIATAGHRRFLKDHDSRVRLATVLKKIRSV